MPQPDAGPAGEGPCKLMVCYRDQGILKSINSCEIMTHMFDPAYAGCQPKKTTPRYSMLIEIKGCNGPRKQGVQLFVVLKIIINFFVFIPKFDNIRRKPQISGKYF